MGNRAFIGEFEQVVLLAILKLREKARGPEIVRLIETDAGRPVSRGSLYSTLNRLEKKGLLDWQIEASSKDGEGNPTRRFLVSEAGLEALRSSRETLLTLWSGLEEVLRRPLA